MRNRSRSILALLPMLVAGCGVGGGDKITASPGDWTQYNGQTVTVRGSAGNSNRGPIVRFEDGGYIPLLSREPWGFDDRGRMLAGRPVEVTGKIVSGVGYRAEKFVLNPESVTIIEPERDDSSKKSTKP
jgi:hypothetical protein